jgi:hypothetical protein
MRLRFAARQVFAQVRFERRHALGFPRGLDAVGDLAVHVHQLAEHHVIPTRRGSVILWIY